VYRGGGKNESSCRQEKEDLLPMLLGSRREREKEEIITERKQKQWKLARRYTLSGERNDA
jgi:hypothetical protein